MEGGVRELLDRLTLASHRLLSSASSSTNRQLVHDNIINKLTLLESLDRNFHVTFFSPTLVDVP
jgi:hypothetical protein